jgi:hypothetical protein
MPVLHEDQLGKYTAWNVGLIKAYNGVSSPAFED